MQADVAQLVEQLIRNQQVVSSSLTVGSRIRNEGVASRVREVIFIAPTDSLRLLNLSLHAHRDAG
jgi:hypothetical protein